MTVRQITFAASDELVDALDKEAFRSDMPRAAVIRTVLADHLRDVGTLKRADPTTTQMGVTNRYFRPRGAR